MPEDAAPKDVVLNTAPRTRPAPLPLAAGLALTGGLSILIGWNVHAAAISSVRASASS